jgi:hypothetical protein
LWQGRHEGRSRLEWEIRGTMEFQGWSLNNTQFIFFKWGKLKPEKDSEIKLGQELRSLMSTTVSPRWLVPCTET